MTTEPTSSLAAALAAVQAELPTLDRDRTVTIEPRDKPKYSYSYVTLARLTETILPLIAKHGLAFTTLPGLGSDGKMCLRYRLLHTSGDSLDGEFPISGEGGIQMIGGRITYARRYCLAALVGVAADEDNEERLAEGEAADERRRARPARRQTPPADDGDGEPGMTGAQQRKMQALYTTVGITDRDDKLRYAIDTIKREIRSSTELTRVEAGQVIDRLERWAAQSEPPDGGETP